MTDKPMLVRRSAPEPMSDADSETLEAMVRRDQAGQLPAGPKADKTVTPSTIARTKIRPRPRNR